MRHVDLTNLRLNRNERVDAVLSNAVFQLVADHISLFTALARALRSGGRLVADCGGRGNLSGLRRAVREAAADMGLAERVPGWQTTRNYAGVDETALRLRAAGFMAVRCWLESMVIEPEEPRGYLETVYLAPYLARLGDREGEHFVDAVMRRMGDQPSLRYVRLNIDATRA